MTFLLGIILRVVADIVLLVSYPVDPKNLSKEKMQKFCSSNFTSKENITKFYDFWGTHYIFPFFSHEQSTTEKVVPHSQLRIMHVRTIAKSNSELIYFDMN